MSLGLGPLFKADGRMDGSDVNLDSHCPVLTEANRKWTPMHQIQARSAKTTRPTAA